MTNLNHKQQINPQQFNTELYHAVDNKDLPFIANLLDENVEFRIANFPAVIGKENVIAANQQFFGSIESMHHTLLDNYASQADILCHGVVDYIRLDGSSHQAFFSTLLKFKDNKINKYFVFADLSQLYKN